MSSFNSAFASARRAGKKTFTWNGRSYTTETREGNSRGATSAAPSSSSRPRSRPTATTRPQARPTTSTANRGAEPRNPSRPTENLRQGAVAKVTRPKARDQNNSRGATQARENAERRRRNQANAGGRSRQRG